MKFCIKLTTILLCSIFITDCGSNIITDNVPPVVDVDPPIPPEPGEWPALKQCVNVDIKGTGGSGCVLVPKKDKRYSLVDASFITCPACVSNFPIFARLGEEIKDTTTVSVLLFKHTKSEDDQYMLSHPQWFGHRVGYDVGNKQVNALKLRYAPTMYLFDLKAADPSTPVAIYIGVLTSSQIAKIKAYVRTP